MPLYPCAVCGKPIEKPACWRKRTGHVFCSPSCLNTPFIPRTCTECGKEFLVTALAQGRAKFCSTSCRNARNRRKQVHKKAPKATIVCAYCGKAFKVRRSIANAGQKYCSQACSAKAIGERARGTRSKKIQVTCAYCGKVFEIPPSRQRKRKYCCQEHFLIHTMKRLATNPRTSIEITMAQALDSLKLQYLEQVILFGKFMVDFLLPKHSIVVQCDGSYWHSSPRVKSRDKGQDRYMAKAGITVLRFGEHEINNDMESCVATIREAINTQVSLAADISTKNGMVIIQPPLVRSV